MDAEFREAFAKLSAQISDVGRTAESAVQLSKENNHVLTNVVSQVTELNKAVFGDSDPPKNGQVKKEALIQKVSSSEMEVDSLKAEIIVLAKKVDTVEGINKAQSDELESIKKSVTGFTGKITSLLSNPKLIALGRVAVGAVMAYAIAKGWVQK